jgi:hypothetical protein
MAPLRKDVHKRLADWLLDQRSPPEPKEYKISKKQGHRREKNVRSQGHRREKGFKTNERVVKSES